MLDSLSNCPVVDEGLGKVLLLSCSVITGNECGIGVAPGVGMGVVMVKGDGL